MRAKGMSFNQTDQGNEDILKQVVEQRRKALDNMLGRIDKTGLIGDLSGMDDDKRLSEYLRVLKLVKDVMANDAAQLEGIFLEVEEAKQAATEAKERMQRVTQEHQAQTAANDTVAQETARTNTKQDADRHADVMAGAMEDQLRKQIETLQRKQEEEKEAMDKAQKSLSANMDRIKDYTSSYQGSKTGDKLQEVLDLYAKLNNKPKWTKEESGEAKKLEKWAQEINKESNLAGKSKNYQSMAAALLRVLEAWKAARVKDAKVKKNDKAIRELERKAQDISGLTGKIDNGKKEILTLDDWIARQRKKILGRTGEIAQQQPIGMLPDAAEAIKKALSEQGPGGIGISSGEHKLLETLRDKLTNDPRRLEAMKTLEKDYGCTLVLCTATQPALEYKKEFPIGWPAEELTSLLGREFEHRLEHAMQRVKLKHLGEMDQAELLEHWKTLGNESALFIVNTTREAQALFDAFSIQTSAHIVHLSARMCPAHRENAIETAKKDLEQGEPLVLIATRVIEAGVDISFPVVYRACAGVDSIAQAAGRCNRHGEKADKGLVFIYESQDFPIPNRLVDVREATAATREILAVNPEADLLSPETANLFFRTYYNNRKNQTNRWDLNGIMGMTPLGTTPKDAFKSFRFKEVENKFKLIQDTSRTVMVVLDKKAEHIWERLKFLDSQGLYPDKDLRRQIQRYSVQIYDHEWLTLQDHGLKSYIDGTLHVLVQPQGIYDEHKGILSLQPNDPGYICYNC